MGDEKSGHLLLFVVEKGERLRHCNRLGSTPLGPRIPRSDGHRVIGGDGRHGTQTKELCPIGTVLSSLAPVNL